MPTSITDNKKPAEATIPGGLILDFSTTPLPPRKDRDNDLYHDPAARRKP